MIRGYVSSDTFAVRCARSEQERLCRLLGVETYLDRWPQLAAIPEARMEMLASAVEHPYMSGERLLLHRYRMPADLTEPCTVCKQCRSSLTARPMQLPRFALANDLWIGRVLPELHNLSAGTKRLLPLIRTCFQVTVLQPSTLPMTERQRGYIGNSIFLPQARPEGVLKVLPPTDLEMAETILFVLVGSKKDSLRTSGLLQAPREEYVRAVQKLQKISMYYQDVELREESYVEGTLLDSCVLETAEGSYLAQQLLQTGPADAVGQEEDTTPVSEETGHLLSSIVGFNDAEDEGMQWLNMQRKIDDLCKGQHSHSEVEKVVNYRAQNEVDPASGWARFQGKGFCRDC